MPRHDVSEILRESAVTVQELRGTGRGVELKSIAGLHIVQDSSSVRGGCLETVAAVVALCGKLLAHSWWTCKQ